MGLLPLATWKGRAGRVAETDCRERLAQEYTVLHQYRSSGSDTQEPQTRRDAVTALLAVDILHCSTCALPDPRRDTATIRALQRAICSAMLKAVERTCERYQLQSCLEQGISIVRRSRIAILSYFPEVIRGISDWGQSN